MFYAHYYIVYPLKPAKHPRNIKAPWYQTHTPFNPPQHTHTHTHTQFRYYNPPKIASKLCRSYLTYFELMASLYLS